MLYMTTIEKLNKELLQKANQQEVDKVREEANRVIREAERIIAMAETRELSDKQKLAEVLETSNRLLREAEKILARAEPRELFDKQKDIVPKKPVPCTQHRKAQDDRNTTSYEVPLEDKEFILTGYPIPSDAIKLHFDSDLEDSKMFEVFEDSKTENQFTKITGGACRKVINEYGHITFVEDMFYDNFDEDIAFTVMNAFFWIFYHMGNKWLPVRSYAIGILSLFPQAILKQYPLPEDFIEAFSRFTKEILSNGGICSMKVRLTPTQVKQGTYMIKATDAFAYLLEPSEYVMADTLAE